MSLLAAIEYIEKIGGYDAIKNAEKPLIEAMLAGFEKLADRVQLIGPKTSENRIGVFSFIIPGKHPTDIADALAEKNICVRAGFHCAEPLSQTIDPDSADRIPSVRASIYFYNDLREVERFFEALEQII